MSHWYEKSFGSDYLLVYKHRDIQGAYDEVRRMMEWLALPKGAQVLDLCCGMGRHSMALAESGFRVTGIDLSGVLLEEARRRDPDGDVRWIRGDMRDVPLQETFDAVVNLFTSFGYFDEDTEHIRVLREIRRLLRPDGRFIIDFLNPAYIKARLVPHSQRQEGDIRIEERRRIEDGFVRKTIVLSETGQAEPRVYEEQVKLIELNAFRALLNEAGLSIDGVYGGYDASPYDADTSTRMIFVGRREGHHE